MKLNINELKTVVVSAKEFWKETDIEISNGEEYKFEAVGIWKDLFTKCDANGYSNWYMNLYNKRKRSINDNWFSLMGSIDKTDDFLIGKKNQLVFQQDGNLFCYANDVKGFYWNNSGQISITITRIK